MADKESDLGLTVKKDQDFSEWYHQLLAKADVLDQRYPLQGFPAYGRFGFPAHDRIIKILEDLLDASGHEKCYFPLLVPESLMSKEKQHIRGFEKEVFWVTHGGLEKLNERLAIRPTSEMPMYETIRNWIRSYNDLPLKIYQSCTVYRYETKHTRPLLRGREILWNEAHTSHATREEAAAQIVEGVRIYKELFRRICIPSLFLNVLDVFAGAEEAIEPYGIYPDGRGLEIGSVNNLGQRFAKALDVKFKKEDGTDDYAYQTCYGISMRLLATVISVHGDDHGMVLPPEIAPVQAVIVPIVFKGKEKEVLDACQKVEKQLRDAGVRVRLDDSANTAGYKFNHWELRGVPVRIEIGPRDLEKSSFTLVKRTGGKKSAKLADVVKEVTKAFGEIFSEMSVKAEAYQKARIRDAATITAIKEFLDTGFARIAWCGKLECAQKLEKNVEAGLLGHEYEAPVPHGKKCIICDSAAKHYGYVGRTY
ncbi:proline--tRNA ligase [Candidatus Micrarchaeota archaeon]|nr:proline--tRNA ligase [Candidatus Micrarchaeota archaeon]